MSRKRGTVLYAEEMIINERLSTKKELAYKGKQPSCPVPLKVRKNLRSTHTAKKPTPFCFNNNVTLSPIYNPDQRQSYLDQVFSKLGCMGEGSFGKVFRVKSKEDKKLYAVKRLKSHVSFNDRCAEVKNNEMLGFSPHCVQYFMAWEENFYTFMLLECCDMSLADYSKLNNNIHEDLLWNVLHDICKALNFLHTKHFLHLDVKPGNIMMKKGVFKLGDFGLLVNLKLNDEVHKSTLSDGDSKYLALEVLDGVYTSACDIFGLGITVLELATDFELPEHGLLWRQLRYGDLPLLFYEKVTCDLSIIVQNMISIEYKERPTAVELLNLPKLLSISKHDLKSPRVDFAASFVRSEDSNDNIPLSPIHMNENNNANISTPPYNGCSTPEYDQDSSIRSLHRKSLFNQLNESFSPTTNLSLRQSPAAEVENNVLAEMLYYSGMECDNSESSSSNSSNNENTNPFMPLRVSTPVLASKLNRGIPKTKLNFE
ncbi:hypothetical protein HUJ04_012498 [Dendroctonus ponderosae]|nr:hypothetical protein HUJ04_012498 [Dendroctonus ponderosae]KAH1023261.1 hypothetical protein HUJ04_012498 [Dendroctonus ponderosae]KAH1029727.1 hypothetical protein HUJ05_002906 [Dendroctonus ponderosae]KAH1029728.1 hypothetical protein HUJ05_002906 [Dendroctonus ponderosae]